VFRVTSIPATAFRLRGFAHKGTGRRRCPVPSQATGRQEVALSGVRASEKNPAVVRERDPLLLWQGLFDGQSLPLGDRVIDCEPQVAPGSTPRRLRRGGSVRGLKKSQLTDKNREPRVVSDRAATLPRAPGSAFLRNHQFEPNGAPERSSFCGPRLSLPLGFDVKSMHFRRRLHHAFVR